MQDVTYLKSSNAKGFGKIDLNLNEFIQTQDHNQDTDAYKTNRLIYEIS